MAGAVALVGILAMACGGDNGGPPSPTSTPSLESATSEPSTAVTVPEITDDELIAIAEAVFPGDTFFGGCDNGPDGQCPVTERLQARIADPNVLLCRCQNGSSTRVIEPLPVRLDDGGGIVRVTMWEGSTSFDLVVVPTDGGWLVDDEYCAGRPDTSIHVYPGLC
jgi:hypothetical protein